MPKPLQQMTENDWCSVMIPLDEFVSAYRK